MVTYVLVRYAQGDNAEFPSDVILLDTRFQNLQLRAIIIMSWRALGSILRLAMVKLLSSFETPSCVRMYSLLFYYLQSLLIRRKNSIYVSLTCLEVPFRHISFFRVRLPYNSAVHISVYQCCTHSNDRALVSTVIDGTFPFGYSSEVRARCRHWSFIDQIITRRR